MSGLLRSPFLSSFVRHTWVNICSGPISVWGAIGGEGMSAAVLGTLYLPIGQAHTYSDKAAMRAVDYFRADTLTNAPYTFFPYSK